jgi:hypothetical protein
MDAVENEIIAHMLFKLIAMLYELNDSHESIKSILTDSFKAWSCKLYAQPLA